MDSSLETRLSFFKITLGDLNSTRLRIPKEFENHIPKDIGEVAVLKGPCGNCYNVTLSRHEGNLNLQQGWKEFAKDNALGDGEFLLFKYDGNLCFEVQIFDKSGVERLKISKTARGKEVMTGDSKLECFTSRNPYAKLSLRKGAVWYPYILILPTEFCRRHLPQHKIKVILRNIEGKVWEVNSIYSPYKHSFCKGWGHFATENNLKQNDICILELVANYEMVVRIFPQ